MQSKTKLITCCAVLIAIAVILKAFLGIPINFMGAYAKSISLAPVIIMFAGILLGPLYGGIAGAICDIICFIINPMGGYFPGYTLTMALYGIIPGFIIKDKKGFARILFTTILTQVVCSAFLNTIWLSVLTEMPTEALIIRMIGSFVSIPVYIVALYFLCKYQSKLIKTSYRKFKK